MSKFIKIMTNWRVLILLFFLVMALWAISPRFSSEGVSIVSIDQNSSAAIAGIQPPREGTLPLYRERIVSIEDKEILTVEDYEIAISNLEPEKILHIETNREMYSLLVQPEIEVIILNETYEMNVTEEVFNETSNTTLNITSVKIFNKTEENVIGIQDIGLAIDVVPSSNIRQGIDLIGGVRFKFRPDEVMTDQQFSDLMDNMMQRLNVYGLADVSVRSASDPKLFGGTGEHFIIVETSSANEEAIETLKRQGKFEARIGNETVFQGGSDVSSVCRSAECSGIRTCGPTGAGYACDYMFSITLSHEAAERHADVTRDMKVVTDESGSGYLEHELELYLDGELLRSLRISEDLKGKATTGIAISGGESGITQEEAIVNTQKNMKDLQTLLITGSLPVKLVVVERTVVPPVVGQEFVPNAMLMGGLAILAVFIVLFIFYRRFKIVIPMVLTVAFEVVMLFGFAAFIKQTIDLAAIAGFVVAIGTGVDHLVIITDETLRGEAQTYDLKKKLKAAFSIIIVAFFTTFVAMMPLAFVGAGVLRGFAFITLTGLLIGVVIARPAYAKVIELLLKKG
ncbi:MAG: MMPL family transporter [Nanoarchaeota archaeon]|nr:MMPL family transporter [Nanoarchaeota archaeon]